MTEHYEPPEPDLQQQWGDEYAEWLAEQEEEDDDGPDF